MKKNIIISWLVVLILVFLIFYFTLIKNILVFLLLLIFLPLIPFLTIFLNKKMTRGRGYYKYGLVLPAVLYYIAYFAFIWMAYGAVSNFTGLG